MFRSEFDVIVVRKSVIIITFKINSLCTGNVITQVNLL